MTRIPTGKVAQIVKEKRGTQIARGVKQGILKGAVDNILDKVASPIADKLTPMLHNLHPNLTMADPAIHAMIEFAILNALAEILEFSGPALAKAPGVKLSAEDAKAKTQALAQWMRNYSGEKFGENIAETAAALIPVFANMIQTTDLSSLLDAVETEEAEVEEHVEAEAA